MTISDNFNRSNSTTTINPCSDGGSWTIDDGTWGISSNQGYNVSTTSSDLWNEMVIRRDTGTTAHYIQITHATPSVLFGGASIRFQFNPHIVPPTPINSPDCYVVDFDSTASGGQLYRTSGGVRTVLAVVPWTAWTGGSTVIKVTTDGAGGLTVSQNGTVILTYTDTTPLTAGTWVGFANYAASPYGVDRWDDFTATYAAAAGHWSVGSIRIA